MPIGLSSLSLSLNVNYKKGKVNVVADVLSRKSLLLNQLKVKVLGL